jgi:uncharacterized protein YcbK (DUF882 family)
MNYRHAPLLLLGLLMFTASGCKKKDMSMKMNEPHNIKGVVSYKRAFNDLNDAQLAVAQSVGIRPIENRAAAEKMTERLELIETNEDFDLDSLTHSIPYLVPEAYRLLHNIGASFNDSLAAKGLNPYKIIVTSVLRTGDDVKRLRKRNGNATKNSAHFYGTTFDISWKRFNQVADEDGRPMQEVGADTLKMVLSEVLRDAKANGKCMVKHELKQGCFHITATKKN